MTLKFIFIAEVERIGINDTLELRDECDCSLFTVHLISLMFCEVKITYTFSAFKTVAMK